MYHASLGKGIKNSGALYLTLNLLFLFIFFNNFMGLLPYADTPTSSLILTF
jgi:F0F1-type ATP synthase membrane subunit a